MTPNPTDEHVGSRVRLRRVMLGMSQEEFAATLGVTVQRVQEYESGAEHIGAARLMEIAEILQVAVTFFFDDNEPTAH